jgi:hypothetical protein
MDETHFAPDATVTRAQTVTFLYRFAKAHTAAAKIFDDVALDAWYAEAVTWASDAGLVQGTDRGFEPDAPATREQIAVILFNYGTLLGLDMEGRAPPGCLCRWRGHRGLGEGGHVLGGERRTVPGGRRRP